MAAEQVYGPVRQGETLWQIAGRVYLDSGLSRDQIMLGALRANPGAFSPPCNVNGTLRAGVMLRLPSVPELAVPDAATSRRLIQEQNAAWASHRRSGRRLVCPAPPSAAELDATEAQAAKRPPETTQAEPEAPKTQTQTESEAETETAMSSVSGSESEADAAPPTPKPTSEGEPTPALPRPPPSAPRPEAVPRPSPAAAKPTLALEEGAEPPLLPEGPRVPAWLIAILFLALIIGAVARWDRRRRDVHTRPAAAASETETSLPMRAPLPLAPDRNGLLVLLLMSALAGFLGALITVAFREGIRALEWLASGRASGLVVVAESLPPWLRLILPAAGGLVAGLLLSPLGGWLRGRTTTDYMEAVAVGDGWISIRHSLVKSLSSLVTVASGGSIGREGAMVQLAAMVASALGRIGRFPRDRLRLLVAAGAAAGLAGAYNAPIAATLFVAEIVLGSIALEHIGPLIVAAVIGSATVHDILGYAPAYRIPAFSLISDWELALYLLLGVLAGHVAPLFLRLLERSHHAFGRLPLPVAGRMALGGLLVGAISVYEPQVWGNGYSVVNAVLHNPWAWQALLTVLVLKMLATACTHGSGAVGGAFTPTLFVGAMLGALFGTTAHAVFPAGTATPSAYAVVGMGAMLAGTTHAPLMSILMVFELTMDYKIVLPLMLAVVSAHYTARRYTGVRPMYADSLLPRKATAQAALPASSAD